MTLSAALLMLGLWATGWLDARKSHGGLSAASPTPVADSAARRQTAEDSTAAFLRLWRDHWQKGMATSHGRAYAIPAARVRHGHCHVPDVELDGPAAASLRNAESGTSSSAARNAAPHATGPFDIESPFPLIRSSETVDALCPSWLLAKPPIGAREDESVDNALLPEHQATIVAARARLIATLAAAAAELPRDEWIVGQRVRFLLDQKQRDEARSVARQCGVSAWLCAALYGYVMHADRNWSSADSAFAIAIETLPPEVRCEWHDFYGMVPANNRASYADLSCAARDTLAASYWWLADPLYSTPGNERRVEHYARNVRVMLSSALDEDERYNWTGEHGSDALQEMIVRYGTPSAAVWIGAREDSLHELHLTERAALTAPPYSTAEYSARRGHFGPAWSALANPLAASADTWEVGPTAGLRASFEDRGAYWWPEEHMALGDASVVQYPPGQVALFRRRDNVQVAAVIDVAAEVAGALAALKDRVVRTVVVASPTPTVFQTVAASSAPFTNRVALAGRMRSYPSLLSIETPAAEPGGVMARTRYGIVPPAPLSDLAPGMIAISDPAFFTPVAGSALPGNFAELLPLMRGTTTVPAGAKLGVYWETYGVAVGDSLDIALSITSTSQPGILQRVAASLRLVSAGPGSLTARWPDAQHSATPVGEEGVAVLARSVVVDLDRLPAGNYSVLLVVTSGSQPPQRTARGLTIR